MRIRLRRRRAGAPADRAGSAAPQALPPWMMRERAGDDEAAGLAPPAPRAAAPLLPYAFARRMGVLLVDGDDGPTLLMRHGAPPAAIVEARRLAGPGLALQRVADTAFDERLSELHAGDGFAAMADAARLAPQSLLPDDPMDLLDTEDAGPVIRLINALVAQAVSVGASDVHLEPHDEALVARIRRDGVMEEIARLPAEVAPMLVSRVKVMARLDISEKRLPQDGRISLTLGTRALDVRVSTLPARGGERVVLRILDQSSVALALDDLGLDEPTREAMSEALAHPNGMVLVTGPTGAGKTTTLYAALRRQNDGRRTILTIEDPVEYAVPGVGQTQVDTRVGLTFAQGLRAILRQDPDVVLVGEIRDRETAEIAVQAALTGHLVLSTVHANSAAGAITRLRDFGVEPFLIAATLRAVVAQRLVRLVCQACAAQEPLPEALARRLGLAPGLMVARARGCPRCRGTGYTRRQGLFELIRVDGAVRAAVNEAAGEARLEEAGLRRSLRQSARLAVVERLTSPAEVLPLFVDDVEAAVEPVS